MLQSHFFSFFLISKDNWLLLLIVLLLICFVFVLHRLHTEKTGFHRLRNHPLIAVQLFMLLTMSIVNEDVLWLEPLLIDNDIQMTSTTLEYQIESFSAASSNISFFYFLNFTNSSTITTPISNEKRFVILKWSVRIIGCLLIIVGGIGNTLSALTLSRKKLRTQVTSIYLIALALSDLGRNIYNSFSFWRL